MFELIITIIKRIRGYTFLDLRIRFHFVAFIHLAIVAFVTLQIDPTVDPDLAVKQYGSLRWRLITLWFNVLTLIYFPICLYCEWQQKNGFGSKTHVQTLLHIGDVLMTSILVPTTMLADVLFWSLMKTDASLVAPPKLFEYLPVWCQHSLHTVSFLVIVLDLLLTPRRMPNNLLPRFAIGSAFFASYFLMVYVSFQNGQIVYSFLALLTTTQHIQVILSSYAAYTAFFLLGCNSINRYWDGYVENYKVK